MINKDGQYKAHIPKAFRTKNKNKSIDGDIKKKCPNCGKPRTLIAYAKPRQASEFDPQMYYISRCTNCNYIHLEPVIKT